VALTNLREEGFNAQATATLATLAPHNRRTPTIEAIVGLQVIHDYLDSLVERPLANPIRDGRQLYAALRDALDLDTKPKADYYTQLSHTDDGDYLSDLVNVVRRAVVQLPCQALIAEIIGRASTRYAEAQVHAHALGEDQLKLWAGVNATGTGLRWREFLAGSVSSGLALHALIAAAADPRTSPAGARAIDNFYLLVCALTTLLDGLIDYDQDLQSTGRPGYIRFYEDDDALAQGLKRVIRRATLCAPQTPNGAHHLMTLVGIAAYYSSAPTASSGSALHLTTEVRRELRPLITPTFALMRSWRATRQARCSIAKHKHR
jgi:hypothetical protein